MSSRQKENVKKPFVFLLHIGLQTKREKEYQTTLTPPDKHCEYKGTSPSRCKQLLAAFKPLKTV